jgi:cbb3-type cytochrome oxidase subunit 3
MIRDLMKYLDASFCAEASLVLFLLVFFAVSVRTLWYVRKTEALANANIPLNDGTEVLPHE